MAIEIRSIYIIELNFAFKTKARNVNVFDSKNIFTQI